MSGSGRDRLSLEELRALGEVIKRLREQRGLNMQQASAKCGVNQGYWNHLERGGKPIKGQAEPEPIQVSDGTLLKIVWGLNLNRDEQAELFDAGKHPHLKPREIKPPDLVFVGDASEYSIDELRQLEDKLARLRFKKEEQTGRKPRATRRGGSSDS